MRVSAKSQPAGYKVKPETFSFKISCLRRSRFTILPDNATDSNYPYEHDYSMSLATAMGSAGDYSDLRPTWGNSLFDKRDPNRKLGSVAYQNPDGQKLSWSVRALDPARCGYRCENSMLSPFSPYGSERMDAVCKAVDGLVDVDGNGTVTLKRGGWLEGVARARQGEPRGHLRRARGHLLGR
ncbi:MAG: hypothetical protein IJ087_13635 [Eggerthellaceae bacterium]|nr:hypothetical protein [Eggerthellaceae bacterium]